MFKKDYNKINKNLANSANTKEFSDILYRD